MNRRDFVTGLVGTAGIGTLVSAKEISKAEKIEIRGHFVRIGQHETWFRAESITEIYDTSQGCSCIILGARSGCETFDGVTAKEIITALNTI